LCITLNLPSEQSDQEEFSSWNAKKGYLLGVFIVLLHFISPFVYVDNFPSYVPLYLYVC